MSVTLGFGFWTTAFALAIGLLHGGTPSILQTDVAFRYDGETLVVQVDPVLIIRANEFPGLLPPRVGAAAFGNVIFWSLWLDSVTMSGISFQEHSLAHELNHVRQFRACGLASPIAAFVLPWEGDPALYNAKTIAECNSSMWLPPRGWPNLAPTLTLHWAISR